MKKKWKWWKKWKLAQSYTHTGVQCGTVALAYLANLLEDERSYLSQEPLHPCCVHFFLLSGPWTDSVAGDLSQRGAWQPWARLLLDAHFCLCWWLQDTTCVSFCKVPLLTNKGQCLVDLTVYEVQIILFLLFIVAPQPCNLAVPEVFQPLQLPI